MENNNTAVMARQRGELCLFYVGGVMCGLSVAYVQEIVCKLPVTKVHRALPWIDGIINLRGRIVSVANLGRKLGTESCTGQVIIVINIGDSTLGLLVEEVSSIILTQDEGYKQSPKNLMDLDPSFFPYIYKAEDSNTFVPILNVEEVFHGRD